MCVVSAIIDYGRSLPDQWDTSQILEFQKVIQVAKQFDAATGQPDCEDPEKVKFLTKLEERLAALEARIADLEGK